MAMLHFALICIAWFKSTQSGVGQDNVVMNGAMFGKGHSDVEEDHSFFNSFCFDFIAPPCTRVDAYSP